MNTSKGLAVVQLDLCDLIMPADKALQLVSLLQTSGAMTAGYGPLGPGSQARYICEPLRRLSVEILKPGQVDLPQASPKSKRQAAAGPVAKGVG